MTFATWYSTIYPRHCARKDAEKAWNALMKQHIEPERIAELTVFYINGEWAGRKVCYIPYPASFLRACDFDDEVEAQEDDHLPLFPVQSHWCPMCPVEHSWDCGEHPHCGLTYEVACTVFMAHLVKK